MVQIKQYRYGWAWDGGPVFPKESKEGEPVRFDLHVTIGLCSPEEAARILLAIGEECIASDARQRVADEARTAGQPR